MSEPESTSERELAQELAEELFSLGSKETPPEPEPEAEPEVVADEPEPEAEPEEPETPPEPPELVDEPAEAEEPEEEGEEEVEDENVVWAKKTFGDDTVKWARALREKEHHISRIAREKTEAEQLAAQWYEYAQQAEQQAAQFQTTGMPLSAAEEEWADQAVSNPYAYARQAVMNGNMSLYNAVISRVAEENPMVAAQIGAQIQVELQQLAAQEQVQYQPPPLEQALGQSFQRLGLSLEEAGPQMMEKVGELGEYHPYVQAMMGPDDAQRDLAVQAVFDLVREGRVTKRRVRDEAREATIRREAELRREAAGVVTGAPHTPPPQEDPFLAAMTEEWKSRRQWGEE